MRKITPKTDKFMQSAPVGLSKGESQPIYPTFRIELEHLPEAKKWKLGETHNVMLGLKLVALSQGRFDNSAEFEIHAIEPDCEDMDMEEEPAKPDMKDKE